MFLGVRTNSKSGIFTSLGKIARRGMFTEVKNYYNIYIIFKCLGIKNTLKHFPDLSIAVQEEMNINYLMHIYYYSLL